MCTVCAMTQTFDPGRHAPGEPVFAEITETTDAAEDLSTTYTMSVGDTFLGTIADSTDEDWIAVDLVAGTTYEIAHNGVTLSDPLVRLYDESGRQIASNDDGGPGLNSLLEYTASVTGTYYISADAFSTRTGSYALSIEEATAPPVPGTVGTLEQLSEYLLEGDQGFSRSYNTTQSNQITVNLTGLTAEGQQLARWAMQTWEMVADLDFVEVTSGEMITVDDEDSGAFAYYPNAGSTSAGVELNVSTGWLSSSGTTLDSYSFQTYIHEFGHALGLRHQGNYNGSASYPNDAIFLNDSWQMSVMSYFSQRENTNTDASFAYVGTAMMADIHAIQELYGAPDENSATAGDTTYGANSNLGNYLDEILDWMATGTTTANVTGQLMAYTVYDRDGVDTFDFSFTTQDARIDMRAEQFSDFGSNIGILGIASGTVIENAILGSGNDVITGNAAGNAISGGDGNDSILGNDGADSLTGGLGDDTLEGGTGDDTFQGGEGFDLIYGADGSDMLFGGDQADRLHGGSGMDTVDGGNGRDLVYLNAGDDLFIDNDQGGDAGRDTVYGGFGNDSIEGGRGRDVFFGGDGFDVISGGIGFDEIYGGRQADTIDGGLGDDTIYGGLGRDVILLGDGNDRFVDTDQEGEAGRDTITGGAGADTFVFGSLISDNVITDFEVGIDQLELSSSLVVPEQSGAAALASNAAVVGTGVLLSFEGGNSILLQGLTSTAGLFDDISFV